MATPLVSLMLSESEEKKKRTADVKDKSWKSCQMQTLQNLFHIFVKKNLVKRTIFK